MGRGRLSWRSVKRRAKYFLCRSCFVPSTLASPPASVPTPDPPSERPLVRDDTLYNDPVVLNQRSRQFKPRRIYDPSNLANFVDTVLDTDIPIENVTASVLHANGTEFDVQTMDGADPAAFLPEPQSLKKVAQLPPSIRDAWLRAYRVELQNMISNNTFAHPTRYRGERCLPIRVVAKTKLRSDGKVDKLKIRIAIRGDLDQGALEEDNSAPLASFRLLKVFTADAARLRKRIYQSDFIAAFLHSRMDRIVYVRLPIEFLEFFPDLAEWFGVPLLLEKSAYGINSAG
jgi:hypothetical protein